MTELTFPKEIATAYNELMAKTKNKPRNDKLFDSCHNYIRAQNPNADDDQAEDLQHQTVILWYNCTQDPKNAPLGLLIESNSRISGSNETTQYLLAFIAHNPQLNVKTSTTIGKVLLHAIREFKPARLKLDYYIFDLMVQVHGLQAVRAALQIASEELGFKDLNEE